MPVSRFIRKNDPIASELKKIKIDNWSRLKEYPYIISFLDKGDIVLDAGCGSQRRGYPLPLVLTDFYSHVYGVDIWDIYPEESSKDVTYIKMDMVNMDFKDGLFDTIVCASVLEHLEEDLMIGCIDELARVLKPQGKLIMTFDVTFDPQKVSPPCNFLEHQLNNKGIYCGEKYGVRPNIDIYLSAEKIIDYFSDYFEIDGEVDFTRDENTLTSANISIFVCKMKKKRS